MEQANLYTKIQKSQFKVFSCYDFLGYGESNYKAISKSLERLTKEGKIKRIAEGLYGKPTFNKTLNIEEPFTEGEIVKALSRKYGWRVAPAGPSALNALGLSQQVPFKSIFVSTGPYKEYEIQNFKIVFKHSFGKEIFECSELSNTFYQALKAIGPNNIASFEIPNVIKSLSNDERKTLLKESNCFSAWMRKYINEVAR